VKDYFEILIPTLLRWRGEDGAKLN